MLVTRRELAARATPPPEIVKIEKAPPRDETLWRVHHPDGRDIDCSFTLDGVEVRFERGVARVPAYLVDRLVSLGYVRGAKDGYVDS